MKKLYSIMYNFQTHYQIKTDFQRALENGCWSDFSVRNDFQNCNPCN